MYKDDRGGGGELPELHGLGIFTVSSGIIMKIPASPLPTMAEQTPMS